MCELLLWIVVSNVCVFFSGTNESNTHPMGMMEGILFIESPETTGNGVPL